MPILTPEEFMHAVPSGARIMALDVGAKTIGLATGVIGTELVMPLKTLARVKFTKDAQALQAIIKEYDVRGLVIGYPLNRDGSEGKRCQSVRDFTAELDRFFMNFPSPRGRGKGPNEVGKGEGLRYQNSDTLTPHPNPLPQGEGVLITLWDERFSTAHGDEMVDNIGKTAGKMLNRAKRDDIIDSLAAQKILEDFIGINPGPP